jgi:hypothetical protein
MADVSAAAQAQQISNLLDSSWKQLHDHLQKLLNSQHCLYFETVERFLTKKQFELQQITAEIDYKAQQDNYLQSVVVRLHEVIGQLTREGS